MGVEGAVGGQCPGPQTISQPESAEDRSPACCLDLNVLRLSNADHRAIVRRLRTEPRLLPKSWHGGPVRWRFSLSRRQRPDQEWAVSHDTPRE
jgi:hypothetical protein